jgi:hypothetical protein
MRIILICELLIYPILVFWINHIQKKTYLSGKVISAIVAGYTNILFASIALYDPTSANSLHFSIDKTRIEIILVISLILWVICFPLGMILYTKLTKKRRLLKESQNTTVDKDEKKKDIGDIK